MDAPTAVAFGILAVSIIIAASRGRTAQPSPRDPRDASQEKDNMAVRLTTLPPIFEFRVALHALPGETRAAAASRLLRTVIAGIRDEGPQPFHFGIDDPHGHGQTTSGAGRAPEAEAAENVQNAAAFMDIDADERRRRRYEVPQEDAGDSNDEEFKPLPMLLTCPLCHARHIDEGPHATRPHKTHACQTCGHHFTPAMIPTVGVQFLPGCKNE